MDKDLIKIKLLLQIDNKYHCGTLKEEDVYILSELAKDDSPRAWFLYGCVLLHGIHTKKDKRKALEFFEDVSETGAWPVTRELSFIYEELGMNEMAIRCKKKSVVDYKASLGIFD